MHYLVLGYALRDQEVMGTLFIGSRQRLLGDDEIFRTPSAGPR